MWAASDHAEGVEISAGVSWDPRGSGQVPGTGFVRTLPAHCAVVLTEVTLGYDTGRARAELDQMLAHAETLTELLAAQTVTHAHLLDAAQGAAVDIGGYYQPDDAKASRAMRPSETLNAIVDGV